jgi:predicted MFS family arabinose efflux permease
MNRSRFDLGIYLLEGLNGLAAAFYFNYLFFFLKTQHGFTNFQNLLVCALNGFLYIFAAWAGGRFGQHRGYLNAIRLGLWIMIVSMMGGVFFTEVGPTILWMIGWTFGVCLTWANIEALICEKQLPSKLPRVIGIYNFIWAAGGAIAYFSGGAIAESLGWRSIYWIPAILFCLELLVVWRIAPEWERLSKVEVPSTHKEAPHPQGKLFLKMAWLANPLAYIAINAAIPLIPDLASRLGLSPRQAGFFCSIWFFSRMFTFAILAVWERWHYRFRYLILSYFGMLLCFAGMLLLSHLWLIVLVQIIFGWCLGLIYYSSLYYSMHASDTKGEHGGFHEAAIGAGIFGGPAIGAASVYFFPHVRGSGVMGVTGALLVGMIALIAIRYRTPRTA